MGKVVGGARVMPTTAGWGKHTYMLRDALHGCLEQIPRQAMPSDVVSDDVWECTRLVISDSLTTQSERANCLSLIVGGLVDIAAEHGGCQLMSLSPLPLMRALRQLGFAANRVGEPYLQRIGWQKDTLFFRCRRCARLTWLRRSDRRFPVEADPTSDLLYNWTAFAAPAAS